ncbi:hypothetical protein GY45DRAFT_607611 [Cubamyces sp. BRFM 1775]|nr:hypothetical protein GY45DRAFT_607611 [Cubamyces sp. BRFM 1775]
MRGYRSTKGRSSLAIESAFVCILPGFLSLTLELAGSHLVSSCRLVSPMNNLTSWELANSGFVRHGSHRPNANLVRGSEASPRRMGMHPLRLLPYSTGRPRCTAMSYCWNPTRTLLGLDTGLCCCPTSPSSASRFASSVDAYPRLCLALDSDVFSVGVGSGSLVLCMDGRAINHLQVRSLSSNKSSQISYGLC